MGGSRRSSPPARQVALLRPVALSTAQLGCAAAVAGACALPTLSSPSAQAALSRVRRRPGSCAPRGRGPAAILPRAQPRRYRGGGGGGGVVVCALRGAGGCGSVEGAMGYRWLWGWAVRRGGLWGGSGGWEARVAVGGAVGQGCLWGWRGLWCVGGCGVSWGR